MRLAWSVISVLLLSASARAAVGPEVALAPAGNPGPPQLHVHLAYAPDHLLAVWSDGQLRGTVDGSPVDLQIAGTPASIIGVAGGSSNFLIAYQAEMNSAPYFTPILALRIGFDGRVLDPAPIVVDADTHGYWGGNVVYDGRDFVIVTMEKHTYPSIIWAETIVTGRVTDAGVVAGNVRLTGSPTSGYPHWPRIAWALDHLVIAYNAVFFGTGGISAFGQCLVTLGPQESGNLALPDCQFPDTQGSYPQPAVAVGSGRVTLAWMNVTPAGASVNIAQTDPAGRPLLSPAVIAVVAPPELIGGTDVEIAWDGIEYLVAWTSARNTTGAIQAVHLAYDGTVIDRQPLVIAESAADDFSLVSVPQGFAVGYSRSDGATFDAFMRTVSRAGPRRRRAVR